MDFLRILDVVLRSMISLVALFFLTKLLGKKQISQLSIFEYIIGISIGSIAAEMSTSVGKPYTDGIAAMAVYTFIAYGISFLTLKSIVIRRFFTGTPTILIQNGKILESNLRKNLLDVNDLLEECRSNGYFDISELEYAVMESSGKVSFLPKSQHRPLKAKDLDVKTSYDGILANIIIDGKVMEKNLKIINKKEKWLMDQLKKQGYKTLDNILLATVDNNLKINVYERNKDIEIKNVLE